MKKRPEVTGRLLEESIFGSRDTAMVLPRNRMPEEESAPDAILQVVKDELFLDGNARQNLATFCQTWQEPQVHIIMDHAMNKNLIDKDEYPQTSELEQRCIHILSDLWNAPDPMAAVGTSCVGSSEACMLAGLAMFRRWRANRRADGKSTDRPNLVTGPIHIVWKKFCSYWDVELREAPMAPGHYYMQPDDMLEWVDENTIGVVTTLGLTFTGHYEPVADLSKALDRYEARTGHSVSLHIDAASGGFLAPFCAPKLGWDFRLPRVCSISASGHKFGLAPLGVGWVVWRDRTMLPADLIFEVNYLGGDMPTFQINFSRPAGQVISQYYLFMRLGREGYRKIQDACYQTARYLAAEIDRMGFFEVVFDGDPEKGIPAVAWRIKDGDDPGFGLFDLADRMRNRGWQIPSYTLPPAAEDVTVQRIIVRQGFGMNMANLLVQDIKEAVRFLTSHPSYIRLTEKDVRCFSHF